MDREQGETTMEWYKPNVYEQHGFTYQQSPTYTGWFDVYYGGMMIGIRVAENEIFAAIVRFGDSMSRD
jgi:hypothetical protein